MQWLLLAYRIPREPTAGRVYVWRKLKQLGAVAVQDAVWVLPLAPRTQEQFQWLAAEIVELGGDVSLFASELVFARDTKALRAAFENPVREQYQAILAALKRKNPHLAALSKQYVQTKQGDYFQSELGERVRARLLEAKGGKSK
jgi:Protein ChrB, N-terminal